MAEQKHTSGPWDIETVPTQVGHAHKIHPVGACLYVDKQFLPHDDINSDSVEAAANAALIAERDEWKAIAQSYDGCLEGIALKLERKKVAELVLENRAYDLRMDNDAKTIADLRAKLAQGAI